MPRKVEEPAVFRDGVILPSFPFFQLFMKESVYQQLEAKRERIIHMAIVTLQRYTRGYLIKKRFYALRRRIILIQARARGYLVRQRFRRLRQTLIKVRCLVHIYVNRRRYLREGLTHPKQTAITGASACLELAQTSELGTHEPCLATERGTMKTVRFQVDEAKDGRKEEERRIAEEEKKKAEQELSKREVMRVANLEIPAELVGLLNTVAVHKQVNEGCVASIPRPKLQEDSQLTLPLDINNYPMTKYVRIHFKPPKKDISMPRYDKSVAMLLMFVSDYAFDGYKPICQHKLMQAMEKTQDGMEAARGFPPTLLEWTSSRDRVNMALDVYGFNGDHFSCPVHSWTTGEALAENVLKYRGLIEGWRGWSVAMKDGNQWAELAGHDYVLDLVSDLELIRGFPKQKSYFIVASEDLERTASGKAVFRHGLDSSEAVPPPPLIKAPTIAPTNLPDSDGYCSHADSDTFSEPRSQKGLDHYLDSLFDPVLSYGNGREAEKGMVDRSATSPSLMQDKPSSQKSVFVKKMDPHEEALKILKGQLAASEAPTWTPPVQLGGSEPVRQTQAPRETSPKEMVAMVKPVTTENKLDSFSPVADESVKKEIVSVARDVWEVYFSRLFPATGSVGTGVQILAVYGDILFVAIPSKNMLEFNLSHEKLILFSPKASQVKALIDYFIMELKKDSQYMVAIKNHITDDKNLLPFHKGDIICLRPMEGLASDRYYGCVVRKKVLLLEDVKKGTLDFGWKFGAIYGKSGFFPADCVQPVAAPDFTHLPAERKEEPKDKQGKVAVSASLAMAVSPAGSDFTESGEGFGGAQHSTPRGGPFTMLEFAKKYFREGQRAKIFPNIFRFPSVHSSEWIDNIICGDYEVIRDEVFCQIIKQITDNTSTKMESCQKGWRLLYILSAYYRCSEVLKPYLLWFLQEMYNDAGMHFQGIAKACEQNLQKTFQFGGRCEFPSNIELKAMVAGRSSKRQLFLLPGGIERHLKIKTCSVARDVIEEICYEMGLQRPEAFDEYIIFAVANRNQNVRPLNKKEYILDVALEMENMDSSYMFWYRRVIWAQPLKFDNELYVTMHYNQVLPDYLKGLFNTIPPVKPSEQQLQQVSRLAALQHRAKDSVYLPALREVQDYIPPQIYHLQKDQAWLDMVMHHIQQAQALSAHQARAQFLGLLSAFPMFGSSFFYIQSCSNNTIELIVTFSLKEIQSTRTQRPSAGSSYPYVEIMLGDLMSQRITQLQLEQGLELCRVIATHMESLLHAREKRLTLPPSEITLL
ncbi:hypothetical protein JD844_020060 [Phrynosoma platyrhinos]|uniref:Unconventional myosin-XV n=1 Tax=Phrynosoma platyrhinos TaxID=52577 RepID=A0ABQ7TRM9_PHRPL|nr:hypothetical protein JD844_020060 [Phrynosoma platyrhinos]